MKKLFVLNLFLAIATFSFAQQTFTSKQEAINFLKEAFSMYFIKTTVFKKNGDSNLFDFEIREKQIIIWCSDLTGVTSIVKSRDSWTNIPYDKIAILYKVDKPIFFNEVSGLIFQAPNHDPFVNGEGTEIRDYSLGNSTYYSTIPFNLPNSNIERNKILQSLINAKNFISNEIIKEKKNAALLKKDDIRKADSSRQKMINQETIDNKIAFTELPPYLVFTSTNSTTSLPDYINKNRPFKNKPTLLITWSNVYCRPCIKIIDSLLNNGVALKYNMVLVNKEGDKTDFSALKTKISNHTPDYNKDAILLFDKNNQLEPIDKNSAPFFVWLDKNMKIVRSYGGYDISVTTISIILAEIE